MLDTYLKQIPDCFNPTYFGKPMQPCGGVVMTRVGVTVTNSPRVMVAIQQCRGESEVYIL